MLFRDLLSPKGRRLLVLFLVGETPTAGIHKEAFESALRQIDKLSVLYQPETPTIPILGPSFSGSAESMETAIRNWLAETRELAGIAQGQKLTVQIVSGSATAIPIASNPAEIMGVTTSIFEIPARR